MKKFGFAIAIGGGVCAAMSVALNNVALGVAIGVAVAAALSFSMARKN